MRLRKIPNAKAKLSTYNDWLLTSNQAKIALPNSWNNTPVYLEIGCGKCNFIYQYALNNPEINFIALEREASILYSGIHKIAKQSSFGLPNLRFIYGEADNILKQLPLKSLSRILLNFPDPWPKRSHHKRRLISKNFLNQFALVLNNKGNLLFKTDNVTLFEAAIANFKALNWNINFKDDLWPINNINQSLIISEYEQKFRERGITILKLIAEPK